MKEKIETDYKIFREETEKESDSYIGQGLEIIKQFLKNIDERATSIIKKYSNHREADLYRAKIMGHVTGLAIKLLAEVK